MRGEQNNILFPVRISWANNFSNLSPFAPPLGLEPLQATAPKLAAQNHLKFEKSCYKQLLLYWHERHKIRGRFPLSFCLCCCRSFLCCVVAVKRTPLKPSIKFIFNGVIKAFYLSDRREL